MKTLDDTLKALHACSEARKWAEGKTLDEAWATCPRGDWMLWLAGKAGVERKTVVLAACACARLALKHVPKGEKRPLAAIETAEAWARGDNGMTLDMVRKAARAAAYAYAASTYAAAAYAAYAASAAAYAASAADADAYAAAYASAADADADAADARKEALAKCAVLVRGAIPVDIVTAALK